MSGGGAPAPEAAPAAVGPEGVEPSQEGGAKSNSGAPPAGTGEPTRTPGAAGTRAPEAETDPTGQDPAVGLADAVWTLLGAIRRLKARRAHDRGGLGTGELRVLGQLGAMGGPTSIGDLGRSAGLNPASTSATVDRLEADGLVARERDTADRRVVRVALTPEGRETVARRVAAWQAEWAVDLAALPEEDLLVTARTLAAIAATIDTR